MNSRRMTTALGAFAVTALLSFSVPATTAHAAECGVRSDGRLYCGNTVGAKGYADRSYRSATRGTLTSGFSWFACWGHGDPHEGQNDIWYWTQLDNGQWGNVPAVSVKTGQDPAPGLREC
ncbi:hypothetical protein [Streptomyces brevispora]|uniref:Peptidase inhibitor family I36 n=1 Tax=Streptomyces brevispora TaxID=887462 RepID=A0A561V2N8_9ACTN|nr:hypothetical protein [Streptomyces brevispora]TWG05885.1 hypothetical protein FHX80_114367 [Streptomyces brevispora]